MTRPHWHRVNQAVAMALGAVMLADMLPFGALTVEKPASPAERVMP